MLSSFNVSAMIGGPLFGRIVDWVGHPRLVFLFTCWSKVVLYILYSIIIAAFFPLVGRLVSGLGSGGGVPIILGQIAIQAEVEDRVAIFVLLEGAYLFIYLALPTRAGSPQQHMPITVGPFYLTHPVNFPCGRKPEYPGKTHDFRQSVDFTLFA